MSFVANPGESIALVGPTGAGKTTIVNLLSRFYNIDSGRILIDGIDIREVTLKSLKANGRNAPGHLYFSGNIIDNIKYGKIDAMEEEVIEAAKAVMAHDFIKDMEGGYCGDEREGQPFPRAEAVNFICKDPPGRSCNPYTGRGHFKR